MVGSLKRKRRAGYFTKSQMTRMCSSSTARQKENLTPTKMLSIDTELTIERNSLISYIRNPSRLPSLNEEMSRKSIADLQVAEEFKAARFTNMDTNKRKVLVQAQLLRLDPGANPTLCFMLLEVIRLVTL